MSLVNEALKRAREIPPKKAAPPTEIPVHHAPAVVNRLNHPLGFIVPVGLCLVALLLLFAAWFWYNQAAQVRTINARTDSAPSASASPLDSQKVSVAETAAPVATSVTSTAISNSAPPVVESQAAAVPEMASRAPVVVAPPPELKLQAIIYNPKRPSAMVSGKVVWVGDRIRDCTVVAIGQQSITLLGPAGTNTLSLP